MVGTLSLSYIRAYFFLFVLVCWTPRETICVSVLFYVDISTFCIVQKSVTVRKVEITFSIWDLGGREEFLSMLPLVRNTLILLIFLS